MADSGNNDNGNSATPAANSPGGLEGFIAEQIQQQGAGKNECNLDEQKRNDFIARAIAESKRMNKEIEKSKAKSEKLHSEFSSSRMEDWRNEHAAEVLTPHQQELIKESYRS